MKLPSVDSVETLSLGAMRRLVAGLVGKMQKLEAEVGALRVENQMLRDEIARQPRMRTARNEVLPASLPPFGVGRTKAAALFDISESLFDKLGSVGKMPQPRRIEGRLIWDVSELAEAFRALPHKEGDLDVLSASDNPWG